MPKATTNINDTERHELKMCPGGFVVLRRLNYGEMIERRAMSSRLNMTSEAGKGDITAYLNMVNRAVTEYEFKNSITDHNLTDDNEQPLDFRSPHTISMLDPRIGEEISVLIDGMNQYEKSLPNSVNGSVPVSS